jgi:outer membrane protein assembly factor BamA
MNKIWLITFVVACTAFMHGVGSFARIDDENLKKKKAGWYFTGIPLVNYTSDNGLGYGGRIYFYDNGSPNDSGFDLYPYYTQLYIQYFTTTNGFNYHELNLDRYNVFGTGCRIKSSLVYDRNINANFYGTGSAAANSGLRDINGVLYETYEEYSSGFLESGDYSYYKYNKYRYTMPRLLFDLYGNVSRSVILLAGFEVKNGKIQSWQGRTFEDEKGASHISGVTLLDLQQSDITGYSGGWTNSLRAGIGYDTRDYPPDPEKGLYLDYTFQVSGRLAGSEYSFYRSTIGGRSYIRLFSPLVLALRVGYADTSGDVPFYEMNNFNYLFDMQEGLGGNRTLRGYPQDRFAGRTMTLGNIELRLKFAEAVPGSQRFIFKLITFLDTGSVYDKACGPFVDPEFGEYKYSAGGGLVITWNLATVIHIYYGVSNENTGLSIDFNHAF